MRCARPPHHQPGVEISYTDFLVTHPLMFAEAIDPLEADNWLRIIESKIGLLHCTEIQKPCSQPSSFVDLRVLDGLTSPLPFRTATRCHGPNSAWLFMGTTSLQA
jgi:hypothetical protein